MLWDKNHFKKDVWDLIIWAWISRQKCKITMLLWPLHPRIRNVASLHSCLEIPILKFLRCRRWSQVNKLIFQNSHKLHGIVPNARKNLPVCDPPSQKWSNEDSDAYDQAWKDRVKRHQSTICTICAGPVSWHLMIKTSCSLQLDTNTKVFYINSNMLFTSVLGIHED